VKLVLALALISLATATTAYSDGPAGTLPEDTAVPFWPHETGALVGTSETFVDVRADGSYVDPSVGRRVPAGITVLAAVEAPAAVPPRLYGVYDDTESGKRLAMKILRAGHPFCTQRAKTTGPCARTPLAGGLIGAQVVVRNDRLSLPETYRTPNLGTLCRDAVPNYRIPRAGSRLILTLVGDHNRAGKPVSARSVRAADCEPPKRWQHRLEEQQLRAARVAFEKLRTIELAQASGYVEASPCIPGEGAHYIKPALAGDAVLDPSQPELLMFALGPEQKLELVGLEYWRADSDGDKSTASDRPTLFGHVFDGPMDGHAPGMPVHYDLHVWLGRTNPGGLFTVPNPSIGCPGIG
jgi:hypothetical protein